MKEKIKKGFLFFLLTSFTMVSFYSVGFSQENTISNEYHVVDVIVARPLGILAGIVGTGVFILSLPFTLPTKSVEEAAKIFMVEPFKFSFNREFPDSNF